MAAAPDPAPEPAAILGPVEPGAPKVALAVTAHPDDVDFGAGGTVARMVDDGWRVVYCLATDGDAGGFDAAVPRGEIPAIRRAEQTEAARLLGVLELHWLGFADGRVEPTIDLRREISRVIRTVQPTRILAQSPQRNWVRMGASHPDHLAVGEATLRAVYPDARNPFAHPELAAAGLDAWAVPEVWMMGGPDPDLWVDISPTFDRKLAALRAHVSQEVDRNGELEQRLRTWMAAPAASGLPPDRTAEAWRRLDTR